MKKFVAILFLSFLFGITNAQIRLAIAGGAQNSSVREENNLPGWDTLRNNYSSRTGFHIGFVADMPFSSRSVLSFQPSIMFTNKGRKFAATYDTSVSAISKMNALYFMNYMEMSLNLALKIPIGKKSKIILGAGPYASFLYNGREKTETLFKNGSFTSDENKDLEIGTAAGQYNNFDYGVNGLFGFEFGRIFLTGNYSYGMKDFYKANTYEGTFRHQVIGGTLGIYLGRSRYDPKIKATEKEKVSEKNAIKDTDKDGIIDAEDNCPTQKGGISAKGCPDKDGDGVSDKEDKCPDVAGSSKYNGCTPIDTDKDGVNDDEDKCAQVSGSQKYNGCPIPDTDNDGINDELDRCPILYGSQKNSGCPDSDSDGIIDIEDRCPASKGTKANLGCPVIKKDIIKKVDGAARRIQFKFRSAVLLQSSYRVLDGVIMVLKDNPTLLVYINGHTSSGNNGDENQNMILSQNRANSVKKYLELQGIDSKRLLAAGYGSSQPLNNGRRVIDKALNRRVELKLSSQ
jgi:OmpA-OmpF porin, OOP family